MTVPIKFGSIMQTSSSWAFRGILWVVALGIVFSLAYKVMGGKRDLKKLDCLDQAASANRASSPIAAVDKYAACMGLQANAGAAAGAAGKANTTADSRPSRCRFVGSWISSRGEVQYRVTMQVDGRFVGEPYRNAPADPASITGAWSVAGNSLAWVYDSGPVWPPDINRILSEDDDGFRLAEVNGSTTLFTAIERYSPAVCAP
jgi:hypothetical protein